MHRKCQNLNRKSSTVFSILPVIKSSVFIYSNLSFLYSDISIRTCPLIWFVFTLWDGHQRNWILQIDDQWNSRASGCSPMFSSIRFIFLGLLALAWRSRLQIQCTRRSKRWMGCNAFLLVLSISFTTSMSDQSGIYTICFSRKWKNFEKSKYGEENFTPCCGIHSALFIQWT